MLETPSKDLYSQYRREIDMEKAMVTVSWKEGESFYKREAFVSRANNQVFVRYSCQKGTIDTKIAVMLHDTETLGQTVIPNQENYSKENGSYFATYNESIYRPGDYGIFCKVFTDGRMKNDGPYICVEHAEEILMVARSVS